MSKPKTPTCPYCGVVALFVDSDSVYKALLTNCYDKERDARTYDGDFPVIAHPPCQLWGSLAFVNYARWGGDHNKPGNDGGLFKFALDTVRRCGGVLEHPAKSRAFCAYGIGKPAIEGWNRCADGGYICEVWQSAYGHKASKATWLYLVGEPHDLRWDRPKGTHQVGGYDQRGKFRNKPTLSKKESNATPREFALELIRLAKSAATRAANGRS